MARETIHKPISPFISAHMLFPCTWAAVSGRMIITSVTHFCCNHFSHSQQGSCRVLLLCNPLPQPEAVQPTPHPWGYPANSVTFLDLHVLRSFVWLTACPRFHPFRSAPIQRSCKPTRSLFTIPCLTALPFLNQICT